ncbi:hypothetical protein KR018_010794 [Drosophila ironensis]|nr:hypothetical protein KR018_010794 [Drosophila ironensis]
MTGLRQQRKRLELLLMLAIGLVWGILMSELLRRARWKNSESLLTNVRGMNACRRISSSLTGSPTQATLRITPENRSEPLANHLFNKTRILCMIPTSPKTHQQHAMHVKKTWGSRCNKLIFMSTQADEELGAVDVKAKEGYSNLWGKMRASLEYVHKHHLHDYDWFLKADDDTYVIMENLRSFLYPYNPNEPLYFGSKLRSERVKQGYMSGGAGYVLSKEALDRFMKFAFNNGSICTSQSYGYEDLELGRCLEAVGVVAKDTRDEYGLLRFIPYSPLQSYLTPPDWFPDLRFHSVENGTTDCCSSSAISFHNSNPQDFYALDFLIYKLKAFGTTKGLDTMRIQGPLLEDLQNWSNDRTKYSLSTTTPEVKVTSQNERQTNVEKPNSSQSQ